tara:strand:- start:376 stop:798 length:423 start_codon:yes stop_codon:yes gene_type:complete
MKTQDEKTLEAMAGIGANVQLPAPYIANKDGTITQQSAVDVEKLKESIIEKLKPLKWWQYSIANQVGIGNTKLLIKNIIDHLTSQGYLNTNEHVKELETQLSVAKEAMDYIERVASHPPVDRLILQTVNNTMQQINGGQE